MLDRADIFIALACAILALGLAWTIAEGQPALSNPDGAAAIHVARNLVDGDGLIIRRIAEAEPAEGKPLITKPPLFPVLIASLAKCGLDAREAAGTLVLLGFSLATGLLYLLARRALPRNMALLAAFLFAIQSGELRWGITIHEEIILVLFILATLLVLATLMERMGRNPISPGVGWLSLGILAGAAQLTSYQAFPLVVTVAGFVLWCGITKLRSVRPVSYFIAGLTIIGLYPFARFVNLYLHGVKPSFYGMQEPTWLLVSSSLMHAFQTTLMGRLIIWLDQPDAIHAILLAGAYILLAVILIGAGKAYRALWPIALFTVIQVATLLITQAKAGTVDFEPRFLAPVQGLILLLVVAFIHRFLSCQVAWVKSSVMTVGLLFVLVYVQGQYGMLNKLAENRRFWGASGDYCHAPQTLFWIRQNIPPGSTVLSAQCGYQLLADANQLYWIAIPPADEYTSSDKYHERWGENDFERISRMSGAKWIVLLRGDKGDPLQTKQGYGPYVEQLFNGAIDNDVMRRIADFGDGIVYSINPDGESFSGDVRPMPR